MVSDCMNKIEMKKCTCMWMMVQSVHIIKEPINDWLREKSINNSIKLASKKSLHKKTFIHNLNGTTLEPRIMCLTYLDRTCIDI